MKRWLVRIFVFLLLGAIVNVVVAWVDCALSKPVAVGHGFGGRMVALVSPPAGWPLRIYQGSYLPGVHLFWGGISANTLFYAGVIGLLILPFDLRRRTTRMRIERGLCPKCAYDLRGTQASVCPECGASK